MKGAKHLGRRAAKPRVRERARVTVVRYPTDDFDVSCRCQSRLRPQGPGATDRPSTRHGGVGVAAAAVLPGDRIGGQDRPEAWVVVAAGPIGGRVLGDGDADASTDDSGLDLVGDLEGPVAAAEPVTGSTGDTVARRAPEGSPECECQRECDEDGEDANADTEYQPQGVSMMSVRRRSGGTSELCFGWGPGCCGSVVGFERVGREVPSEVPSTAVGQLVEGTGLVGVLDEAFVRELEEMLADGLSFPVGVDRDYTRCENEFPFAPVPEQLQHVTVDGRHPGSQGRLHRRGIMMPSLKFIFILQSPRRIRPDL